MTPTNLRSYPLSLRPSAPALRGRLMTGAAADEAYDRPDETIWVVTV
jgi:hypothetical protein